VIAIASGVGALTAAAAFQRRAVAGDEPVLALERSVADVFPHPAALFEEAGQVS
jgi:hypothetical protein